MDLYFQIYLWYQEIKNKCKVDENMLESFLISKRLPCYHPMCRINFVWIFFNHSMFISHNISLFLIDLYFFFIFVDIIWFLYLNFFYSSWLNLINMCTRLFCRNSWYNLTALTNTSLLFSSTRCIFFIIASLISFLYTYTPILINLHIFVHKRVLVMDSSYLVTFRALVVHVAEGF